MRRAQARLDAYRHRCIAELVASGTPEARLECAAYRAAAAVSPGIEFCSDGLVERLARRLGESAQAEIDAATPGPANLEVGSRAVAVRALPPGATDTRQRRIEMWEEVERSAMLDRAAATERAAQARRWAAEMDAVVSDEGGEGGGESAAARRGQKIKGYFHTPETKDALWEAFSAVAATPAAREMGIEPRGAGWAMPVRACGGRALGGTLPKQFCKLVWADLVPRLEPELRTPGFRKRISDHMRLWYAQADGVTLSRAGRARRV